MDITLKPTPSPYLAPFLPRHHHHKTQLNQQQFRQIKDEPTAILACSAKCNGGTGRFSKSATSPFINDLFCFVSYHLSSALCSNFKNLSLNSDLRSAHPPPPLPPNGALFWPWATFLVSNPFRIGWVCCCIFVLVLSLVFWIVLLLLPPFPPPPLPLDLPLGLALGWC